MFVVLFNDGSVLAQGPDMDNWDKVPSDKSIASVILTDGGSIQERLTGYDFYLCAYWDKAVLVSSAGAGNIPKAVRPPTTMQQSLYGINTHSKSLHDITQVAQALRVKLNEFYTDDLMKEELHRRARSKNFEELATKEAKLREMVKSMEVTEVKLSVERLNYPREKLVQDSKAFREGTGGAEPISLDKVQEYLELK